MKPLTMTEEGLKHARQDVRGLPQYPRMAALLAEVDACHAEIERLNANAARCKVCGGRGWLESEEGRRLDCHGCQPYRPTPKHWSET